jgi:uncharacterized protein YndB with AHSA1/START domain
MADRVLVEILVAAPVDVVWKALREPAEVCKWFGWDYPSLASDIDMMWGNIKVDEERRRLYDDDQPDRFEVEPVGDQTIVRVIRSAPATDSSWHGIYDDVFEGWMTFMNQLKFALERHAGEQRATLFLNGRAKQAGVPNPIDALGLSSLWVVPVGDAYTVKTAAGDTLSGKVYYRSAYQMGLTVDSFGDGLLIASVRPKTEKSHHGGGSILLTTYRQDDAALKALRERWSQWWKDTYEVIEIQP